METNANCPHCDDATEILVVKDKLVCQACDSVIAVEADASSAPEPFVSQLPKKFLADDPDFLDRSVGANSSDKVFLLDGEGGVKGVKKNVVKIQHKGTTIELVALSPEAKRKRQFWINLVSISIGLSLIALFFWLVY